MDNSGSVRGGHLHPPANISISSVEFKMYMNERCAYHRLLAFHLLQNTPTADETNLMRAEEEIKASLEACPESCESWILMGQLRCRQGNSSAAIKCFESAMQLESWSSKQHRQSQLQLASIYLETGMVGNRFNCRTVLVRKRQNPFPGMLSRTGNF